MSVVKVTLTSNGQPVNDEFALLYVDISHEYNKIPSAELGFIDGDFAQQEFKVSDSDVFEPGAEIQIKLGYDNEPSSEKTVFKGVVIKHGLQVNGGGGVLVAELCDKAIMMTSTRKNVISAQMKDSDVIHTLISSHGLGAAVEATHVDHEKVVQYNATDWDFMVSRAEANGLFISVEEGKVSAKTPSLQGNAVLSLELGGPAIFNLEVEVDARQQLASIKSNGWNAKEQKVIVASATQFSLKQGNLLPDKLADIVDGKEETLISGVSMDTKELQSWADAKMVRSRLSMLKGRVKVQGTAQVKVGDLIKLTGVGERFSGKTLVSGVRHQLMRGEWTTDIQFGIDAESFLSKNTNVIVPKAAGLLPGINGLQIGIVVKINEDPENEDRVNVKVPGLDDDNSSIWARVVSIDAGKDRGLAFWPEVGDEVILGFLNDDPRQPVILGSVHSSANPSPIKADNKNAEKGIVTRAGLKLFFNDEEKTIVISTSDQNVITINEKEKSIELKDANDNSVLLSDKGITMKSGKDIIIDAAGNVKIKGTAVEIKGDKVDVT